MPHLIQQTYYWKLIMSKKNGFVFSNHSEYEKAKSFVSLFTDIEYAKKCITQASNAIKAAHKGEGNALTKEEIKSNEGMHLASALYGLNKDIESASHCLLLIKMFRDPEKNKEFIDQLDFYSDDADYSNSLNPPSNKGDKK